MEFNFDQGNVITKKKGKSKKNLGHIKQPAFKARTYDTTRSINSRDAEDYQDEIKTLKYRISMLSAENQSLKSRCRQMQDGLIKKEKELASLTDPSENVKLLQTLGDNRAQTVRIFRQLHQKLFKLEGQLKEKEAQYNRVITDLKYTRVEELRLQLDTAFTEIERLQMLTTEQSSEIALMRDNLKVRANKKKSDPQFTELIRRVKTLGQVIKSMDEQNKELVARNDYLVNRMQRMLANDPKSMREIKKDLAELEANNEQDNQSESDPPEDSVLVAKMIESKLSSGVREQHPVARPLPVKNNPPSELSSVRGDINLLESSNQQLRKDVSFYKKQLELTKLQLDNVSADQSSVKTYDSSPRKYSPRKEVDSGIPPHSQTTVSKEDQSAILIQRAWRVYRNRGLILRREQKAQNMQDRAAEREKEAATKLLKSAVQGHLSRENSLRSGRRDTESESNEIETGTFCTDDEGDRSLLSETEKKQSITDLKAAIRGHLAVDKSWTSLQSLEKT